MSRTDPRLFSDPFFWQGDDTTYIGRSWAFGLSSGDYVVVDRDAVGLFGPTGETVVPPRSLSDGLFDEPPFASLAGGLDVRPGFAELSDGSFALAFVADSITDDGGFRSDLFLRSFDSEGAALSDVVSLQASDKDLGSQVELAAVEGGVLAVWTAFAEDVPGFDGADVVTRRFDPLGNPVSPEMIANVTLEGRQFLLDVTELSTGEQILTYSSSQSEGRDDGLTGTLLQVRDADGTPLIDEVVLPTANGVPVRDLQLAALSDGRFAAAFESAVAPTDDPFDGDETALFARVFDLAQTGTGTVLREDGPLIQLTEETAGLNTEATVTATADGGFLATWVTVTPDPDRDSLVPRAMSEVFGRYFDADGQVFGPDVSIFSEPQGDGDRHTVADNGRGALAVTWTAAVREAALFTTVDNSFARILSDVGGLSDAVNLRNSGPGDDVLEGSGDGNLLRGFGGADLLTGLDGRDTLDGGAGDDTLQGGSDRDRLDGGPGDDLLDGGTAIDILIGGGGLDTALGGAGRDVFVLMADASPGQVTILDFSEGDRIAIDDRFLDGGDSSTDIRDVTFREVRSALADGAAAYDRTTGVLELDGRVAAVIEGGGQLSADDLILF